MRKNSFDSISSDLLYKMQWMNCSCKLAYETLTLMFKFKHNLCSEHFLNYFDNLSITEHTTRNSNYLNSHSTPGSASSRYLLLMYLLLTL